jgi:hypothetical protein
MIRLFGSEGVKLKATVAGVLPLPTTELVAFTLLAPIGEVGSALL